MNAIRLFLLIAILFFNVLNAQEKSSDNVQPIIALLKAELAKTGMPLPEIGTKNTGSSSGTIRLELLANGASSARYGLTDASKEAFYIKGSNRELTIISTTTTGLKNGVYWYLGQLGFRYYFPNELWQHVPKPNTFFIPVEKLVSPSFGYRRIWYAYGTGSKRADNDYNKWFEANLLGGEEISAGHSYDGIVSRNKKVFLEHPEYFAQKVQKGKTPPDPKFEVGNEALVRLVIDDALRQVESAVKKKGVPPAMISMDPSDGGGFSTSEASLKIGGPSEQVFYLANRVAKAVRERYPTVRVGLYAYNFHAAPPAFAIEPNITVLIATAMNQSAYRTDELIEMWQKKGVTVGIRDYFGVMAWDWDMPGQPNGSKISYVSKLKSYYQKGVRLFTAETNIGWISRGLGHFIAAQMLWDVNADINALQKSFFSDMFGKAAPEMEQLFNAWQQYKQAVPLDGDMLEWYNFLIKAGEKESDINVQARITHVKQYLHYVFLYRQWKKNSTDENLVSLLNFAYRVQSEGIVASYPLFRRLANAAVKGKANMKFDDPAAVWKQPKGAVTAEETEKNFNSVLGTLNPNQKTVQLRLPEAFSIPIEKSVSTAKAISPQALKSKVVSLRGGHTVVFQIVENEKAAIQLVNGLIKANQYKKLVLKIYEYDLGLSTSKAKLVMQKDVAAGKNTTSISLATLKPGTYMAFIDDAKNGFKIGFSGNVRFGIVADDQRQALTFSRNELYFQVKNIETFSIRNGGVVTIESPKGRVIDLQNKKGLIKIEVQKGEEGFWKMSRQSGVISLQGITPLLFSDKQFALDVLN